MTRPLLLVWGNCQAESLRLLLDSDDVRTVRLPAVHEVGAAEVPALHRLVAGADLLVSQPVRDDYHGLPLGTAQLTSLLAPAARTLVVPVVRFAGLHPYQLVVHPPGLRDPEPPVVAYHDLRTATVAAWRAVGREAPVHHTPAPAAVRAVATRSLDELARRERDADVVVSDLFDRPTFDHMRTVNHPGNPVLVPLAARVRAVLGLPPRPPGVTRPLLTSVRAPREAVVAAAYDLGDVPEDEPWVVDGRDRASADVRAAQEAFYARRPDVLAQVLGRSAPERAALGLVLPDEVAA